MGGNADRIAADPAEREARRAATTPQVRSVARLGDLPFAATRAVIINCGTKWVTSLALVSALAHVEEPILVIDCESRDGSRDHFAALAQRHRLRFEWLEWPLRAHPAALDALFAGIASDRVLLIDSDVEVRSRRVFEAMREALETDPRAYGAGFVHGPAWMGAEHGLPERTGYYAERMWIPFVLLRTGVIREALASGHSFGTRRAFREIPGVPVLSRLIGHRYRLRGLRRLRLPAVRSRRTRAGEDFDGRDPAFVDYDTGAELHAALVREGRHLAALPPALWGEVHHFHGVSRTGLAGSVRRTLRRLRILPTETQTAAESILPEVLARLRDVYGVDVAALGARA